MKKKRFTQCMVCFLLGIWADAGQVNGQETVSLVPGSTVKIEQLVGDWDNERNAPAPNRTLTRFGLPNTDLGVPFEHNGKIYLLFGDVFLVNEDPIGFTTDTVPEDGIRLDFLTRPDGTYRPLEIPGVSLEDLEVPMEGISWNGKMYLYCATDHLSRSVLAVSEDDGGSFTQLYGVSESKFINVSLVKTRADERYPGDQGKEIQLMFGSGAYRESDVYLAYQSGDAMEEPLMRYFSGTDSEGVPQWSDLETDAAPVIRPGCVGELSVSYNPFLKKYLLLYNCDSPRGINCRVSEFPWGPWSDPLVIFDPSDGGYCHFIHANWEWEVCDSVHDPGREYEWGGEYGPYQFDMLATGSADQTTIYYTLSTWNPYTVVLMKSTLKMAGMVSSRELLEGAPEFSAYPNPTRGDLTIRWQSPPARDGVLRVRTLTGAIAKEKRVTHASFRDPPVLDLKDLPPGLYLLEYWSPDTRSTVPVSVKIQKME